MVRTFPESCLVVRAVYCPVLADAPEPFPVFAVDEIVPDEFPAFNRILKSGWLSGELPEIEISYDSFGLNPPVSVSVNMPCGIVLFINHPALCRETLAGGSRNPRHFFLHLPDCGFIAQNESCLVQ